MWLMRDQFPHHIQHMIFTFLAGIYFSTLSLNKINPALSLLLIAENASTAQISVIRSFLVWRKVPNKLLALTSTKKVNAQFTFFFKQFAVSVPHSCRNIPLNKPYIVSWLVFPHFFEGHATPFKSGVVFAREQVVG